MASSVDTVEDHINHVISEFTLSTGVQLVVLILSGLSMAMAVGFGVWTFVNRKGRVVKASQPFFLYMICLGVFVLSLAPTPLAIKASSNADDSMHEIACNAKVWLYAIGCSVILSALEAKLDRINRIMRSSSRCVRIKVTVCDTVTHMIALVGLNSFILILMTFISPIKYEPVDKIEFDGETIELRGTCIYGDSIGFLVALVVIFLVAMGRMAFQAYNARKLSTEYSESKFIFIILVTGDVIVILGAPVLYLAREHIFVNIRVYVASAMNFTVCVSVLSWIFVPKILYAKEKTKSAPAVHVAPLTYTPDSNRRDNPAMNESSMIRSEESRGESGERIVTRKSKSELLEENENLRRQIQFVSGSFVVEDQGIVATSHTNAVASLPLINETDHEADDNLTHNI